MAWLAKAPYGGAVMSGSNPAGAKTNNVTAEWFNNTHMLTFNPAPICDRL